MRFTRQTCLRALAVVVALFTALAVDRSPALGADAVDEQIAAMKGFEKAGEDGKCIAKMQEMKDAFGDTRVLAAIKSMIGSKNDKIACAAVKMIAARTPKDLEFLKLVCNRVDEKNDLYKEKDKGGNPELVCAYLDAIVSYKADKASQATIKAALPKLADVVKKFLATNAEFSTRAIRAYGCVRDKFAMEQLLEWGEQTEAKAGGSGGGSKKGLSTEAKDMQNKAKKVILETISDITGKESVDVATWRKWWTENGKTFVFPDAADPSAPDAGPVAAATVDPAAAEFKDGTYGFSVKKPEGETWVWAKSDYTADETPRVMLKYAPESGEVCRAYFIIHPVKHPPSDVKGMVKWALEDPKGPFQSQLEPADEKHAPKAEERPNGWTVVIGKGNGLAQRAGFGSQERRFYFFHMGGQILYVDAVCRLGADDDVKAAFWKALDNISTPPPPKK